MKSTFTPMALLLGMALVLAACSPTASTETARPADTEPQQEGAEQQEIATNAQPETVAPAQEEIATATIEATDPAIEETATLTPQTGGAPALPPQQGQQLEEEYHWNQLLMRDDIKPIYEPNFVTADAAPYDDEELVIGVEINGETKAYAIGTLNWREMVNDTVGGTPVLVTW
jgi:hypothetical protein